MDNEYKKVEEELERDQVAIKQLGRRIESIEADERRIKDLPAQDSTDLLERLKELNGKEVDVELRNPVKNIILRGPIEIEVRDETKGEVYASVRGYSFGIEALVYLRSCENGQVLIHDPSDRNEPNLQIKARFFGKKAALNVLHVEFNYYANKQLEEIERNSERIALVEQVKSEIKLGHILPSQKTEKMLIGSLAWTLRDGSQLALNQLKNSLQIINELNTGDGSLSQKSLEILKQASDDPTNLYDICIDVLKFSKKDATPFFEQYDQEHKIGFSYIDERVKEIKDFNRGVREGKTNAD